jgi:hypothetical protein
MAHEWHKGVLSASSWHGLESVEALPDAATMIRRGEETGAWPIALERAHMQTADGLVVPGRAVVGRYADSSRIAYGAVGNRYRVLDPKEWRATIEAAVKAGAKPAGAFSLRGGSRVLATFEIGSGEGIRHHLNLVDAFDGSLAHSAGGSSVRVVCANTLAQSLAADGHKAAKLRHTGSINDRAEVLREAIEEHVRGGEAVAELYREARKAELTRPEAEAVFALLFPEPSEDDKPATATRRINARRAAARAMRRAENQEGRSLATLWNAATWLVDRDETGRTRPVKGGGELLDSMLFGSRGDRVEEIRSIVQVILRDGTVADMEAPAAAAAGVSPEQIGRQLLDSMLT